MLQHKVSRKEAMQYAEQAADKYGLPQTVYFDGTDWLNTSVGSKAIREAKRLFATILPKQYFQA